MHFSRETRFERMSGTQPSATVPLDGVRVVGKVREGPWLWWRCLMFVKGTNKGVGACEHV